MFANGPKYLKPKAILWKHTLWIFVEDYARQWAKREKEDFNTPSKWVKSVRSFIHIRITKLKWTMSTRTTSIFKDPNVDKHLSLLHDKYVIVSAVKSIDNIVL